MAGTRTYTAFAELDTRQVAVNGAGLYDVDYTYDDLGRIVQEVETIDGETHTFTYDYDPAGRLSQVTRDGTVMHAYTFDANGNRLSHTSPAGTQTGTYDAQDRIIGYGDTTYTHTLAGDRATQTTPAGTTTYDYDAAGNLRRVELPDGTIIEYLIDGRDRRIGRQVDGVLQQGWLYRDRLNPVAETDATGQVVKHFIYGDKPNVPAYMVHIDPDTGTESTYRIISDHLGSVRLVVDTDTGAIAQRIDYSPFGEVILDTNPGFQPFGFAGGLYDQDTKLIRFGARDYDPEIGRWTAKDSILFGGGDTNLYGYVFDDPVNMIDPNGFEQVPFGGSIADPTFPEAQQVQSEIEKMQEKASKKPNCVVRCLARGAAEMAGGEMAMRGVSSAAEKAGSSLMKRGAAAAGAMCKVAAKRFVPVVNLVSTGQTMGNTAGCIRVCF